ncbi:MAG: zf-TFIIB domain-containing protein [Planctomycetota bacterium]|nr:zf-TFIIB domain-containing protein [Planctomycetota bacterium]
MDPPLTCPSCGEALIRHELAGIALATCNDHGRWLSHPEMNRLVEALSMEAKQTTSKARRRVRRLIRTRRARREAANRQRSGLGSFFS